ncbi:putative thrombospondin type-1 domain-containing protein 7B-like [Apostichopus japonicus]|uniref:Putative thrombospondin type-1 domain-containing protein 7B-like n=1 Tax=Stichopus japonicus TaxID=307972 RepID=A0A2G8JNJ7_STIJA|nr:putative thrombospondin type-1 domain-containing protein 7B-like [Apostichopus japonicus]
MADGRYQPKNLSRTFHLSYLFLLITEFLVTTTQESAFILEKDNFKWNAGPWMKCQIEREDSCTQKRKVDCRNGLDQRAPPTFCKPSDRPEDSRQCSPCPEACLLTAWTAWSECSATCSPAANRIRSREVLRPEVNQGYVCGELSQFEVCVELPDCGDDMVPIYTWRTGEWTSCRKIDSLISGECGLGQRTRSVACLDETGRNVPEDGCLYRNQGQTPADLEICSVPCDCVLSDWSEWSLCSQTCLDTLDPSNLGYQTRSREILRLPDKEGLPCAHEWQGCIPRDGICGGGKEWRQVYCIKVGDTTKQPVEEKHCLQTDKKPLSRRACWRDCPVDCQLGEWENWSPCSRSCGDGGFHVRMREVLRPPAHGGQPCDAQYQTKECEPVDCAWWRTDSWSTCFLDSRDSACGRGLWYRVVYCISALDTEVDSSNCEGITKPLPSDQCSVPCPEDCIVSEWSKWSPCSVTCGKQGGMQTRWREILAYGADSEDCLREDQLVQTNVCNLHVSCDAYIWQISPWEECTSMESVDACGDDVGVQKRNVTCEIDSESFSRIDLEVYRWLEDLDHIFFFSLFRSRGQRTLCSSSEKPDTHQSCSIPCPVDCVVSQWSEWSGCNQTCGHEAHQERSRVVLLLEANGGIPCPEGANEEGVLLESRACDGVPPCYSYQWLTGNWSHCLVARDQCGQGLRDRQVSCERNDGTIVDPGFCVREIFGPVPLTHEPCYVACGGDCELSDWTPYGPCEHHCEPLDHVGYCRRRSRELLVDHPEDIFALCPHLSADELLEVMPCTSETHNYTANIGPWSDCILGPSRGEDCSVECPQDCTVSSWLSWSSCSARCGTGVKVRQRETVIDNSAGGKVCPHLSESVPCRLASCVNFVWTVGDWSPCYLTNTSSNCGPGLRNRTVACPAGEEFGADCAQRNPKPPIVTPCELPCVEQESYGDSRSGGEWPTCGDLSEVVDCDVESCQASKHRLETSVWTECQPHHGDCGPGIQWQVISCMNEVTGLPVSVDWCNQSHEVQEQACFIHCRSIVIR